MRQMRQSWSHNVLDWPVSLFLAKYVLVRLIGQPHNKAAGVMYTCVKVHNSFKSLLEIEIMYRLETHTLGNTTLNMGTCASTRLAGLWNENASSLHNITPKFIFISNYKNVNRWLPLINFSFFTLILTKINLNLCEIWNGNEGCHTKP